MKKIMIALALTVWFGGALAAQSPELAYRFQQGDELNYKLEMGEINEEDYAYRRWIQFKVLDARDGQYQMSMTYVRFYENLAGLEYDSNDYYPGILFDTLNEVEQIALDNPIFFTLSEFGDITDIRYSESLREAIKDNILGVQNKNKFKKISLLSFEKLRATIRNVFPLLDNNSSDKWTETLAATSVTPKLKMDYTRKKSTAEFLVIHKEQDFRNIDKDKYYDGELKEFKPGIIWTNSDIYLNKSTGVPESIEGGSGFRIVQKYLDNGKQTITMDHATHLKIQRLPDMRFGQFTTLKGTLREDADWEQIRIHVWDDFPDKDLLDVRVEPVNNEFYVSFYLDRPTELAVVAESKRGNLGNYGNILIEPGDSMHIDLSYAEGHIFSGRGATKNELWHEIQQLGLNLNPQMSLSEVRRINRRNIRERTALLEEARHEISGWAYDHLNADIYFREQRNLLNYYDGNRDREPNAELFQKIFAPLDLDQFETSRSFEFRWFIKDYLKAKAQIVYDEGTDRGIPNRDLYSLAGMVLYFEHEYFMKAQIVFNALKTGQPRQYEPLYIDFIKTYPGTPLIKTLKAAYDKRGNIALGQKAHDFQLNDLNGNVFRLSQLRDRWVMLVFCDLENELLLDDLERFAQLSARFPEDQFQLVVAFTHDDPELTSEFISDKGYKAVYLDNHGWKNPMTQSYNLSIGPKNFLINPDGEFDFIGGIESWEEDKRNFEEYIEQDIAERNLMKGETNRLPTLWILVTALVLIFSFWLYFRLKTANMKKKEQEKLEKVELEIKAVRSQLNPHFLFNAMSSIQHLVNSRDNEKANIFLSKFAGLMRKVLNQADLQLLSLAQEVETLTDYLDLEALRHGFEYRLNVSEAVDIHNIDIPPMLLQPFVENAVVHGISQLKEKGEIVIDISLKSEEAICIRILDNGMGLNQATQMAQSNGKGLDLTRRRVALLMEKFKNEISFALSDRHEFDGQRGAFAEIIVGLEN